MKRTSNMVRRLLVGVTCIASLGTRDAVASAWTEERALANYLATDAVQARLNAAEALGSARATAPALLGNPRLQTGHEQEPGGPKFSRLGGTLSVDLGLASLVTADRAGLLREAIPARRDAARIDAVCTLRPYLLTLWQRAQEQLSIREAQERLDRLTEQLAALERAGERAGYEVERVRLASGAHRVKLVAADVAVTDQQAQLEVLLGEPITDIELGELKPPGSLTVAIEQAAAHPALQVARLEADAAALTQRAVRRSVMPDLQIQAAAVWSPGVDRSGYDLGATLELPIFDRSRADRRVASAGVATATATYESARLNRVARAAAAWRRAQTLAEPPEMPDGVALWGAAIARYQAGEESLASLLQLTEEVETAHLALIRFEVLKRQALLELDCAVGRTPGGTR